MSEAPLFYISSAGEHEDPGEMHLARFANALRKVERDGRGNPNWPNLARLKEVFTRRQAEWDAANPK